MAYYYRVTARVAGRPNGAYRYRTDVPTFTLADTDQMITSAADAARIARTMIADLVRQDMSAGATIHGEVYCVASGPGRTWPGPEWSGFDRSGALETWGAR